MLHVLLEKYLRERKVMTFPVLRFWEISGLCCGVLFLVLGQVVLMPVFFEYSPELGNVSMLLVLINSSILSVVFSFCTIAVQNFFWKFFFIGTQVYIFSSACYRLITQGFSNFIVNGFLGSNTLIITIIALPLFWLIKRIYRSVLQLGVVHIPGVFAVGKFPADEQFSGKFNDSPELFFSTTRTQDELSVITESKIFLRNYPMYDDLLLFEFTGSHLGESGEPNVLFIYVLRSLSHYRIPHFSISTFERSYVLLKSEHLSMAKHAWAFNGIKVKHNE